MTRRSSTLARAAYRLALTAFPADVRREFGSQMMETFAALLADRRTRGSPGRFVARACVDALGEGAAERVRRWRRRGRYDRAALTIREREGMMIGDFVDDVAHTFRGIARAPGASAILVLTLALGIGGTTAVFSVLQGVLFQPLPYEEPEELVTVRHAFDAVDDVGLQGIPGPDLLDYIEGVPSLEALGSVFTLETNLNDDQGAARITIGWVTPGFFDVLRPGTAAGRLLEPSDWTPRTRAQMEDPNFAPPPMPVLLSHGLWRDRFGSDPDLVGRSVTINGTRMNVVGVLAEGFRVHAPADASTPDRIDAYGYLPIPMSEGGRGGGQGLSVGRLADGAGLEQARSEAAAVAATLVETFENHARFGTRVVVEPLRDGVVAGARGMLWILFGSVTLVLLISVLNVANLMLVRASARRQEFAVRAALGVARGRVVRQLLTESLVLSGIGAAAGLVLAAWGLQGLVALAPADLPRTDAIGIDAGVLLFTVVLSMGSAVLFGLVPALSSARVDGGALVSARGSIGQRSSVRLRNALIVGELALSVVLVAGSGLLLRSFSELMSVDAGYDPDRAVAVDLALPFFTYRALEPRQVFFGELLREARALPGVTAAGVSPSTPLTGGGGTWTAPFGRPGADLESESAPRARYRAASSGYFEALGARLVAGRFFGDRDGLSGEETAVVIDRRLAEATWPGQDPVGQYVDVLIAAYIGQGRQATARVVGVVEPIRFDALTDPGDPHIWIPFNDYAPLEVSLVLAGPGDPAAAAAGLREVLRSLDPGVPVYGVRYLTDDLAAATAQNRYALLLLGTFAAVALLLGAVGLYGVVSTSVQQRTREIGVRLALGAPAREIGRMVLRQGAVLTVTGVGLGIAGTLLAGPALQRLLFAVEPTDAVALVSASVLLGAVALLAAWIPATRASRLDPVLALRNE